MRLTSYTGRRALATVNFVTGFVITVTRYCKVYKRESEGQWSLWN